MPYNEEALNDAYLEFQQGGYTDTREDFSKLLASNPDAFKDAYSSFTNQGYGGSGTDFAELLGFKIKTKQEDLSIDEEEEEIEEETTDETTEEFDWRNDENKTQEEVDARDDKFFEAWKEINPDSGLTRDQVVNEMK